MVAALPSFPLQEGREDEIPSRSLFRGSLMTSRETQWDWGASIPWGSILSTTADPE